ncbi:SecDF P1 head subdomain-containing protein [Haloglycomyces albus]|uniref:SecDF P1 head subdomain-containing protein n=1 Tax=Haloglycomyces albus TaxID=526067 RepID=UPI00046CEB5B|nr:hypothetical protein [Haloglycomyces albus]
MPRSLRKSIPALTVAVLLASCTSSESAEGGSGGEEDVEPATVEFRLVTLEDYDVVTVDDFDHLDLDDCRPPEGDPSASSINQVFEKVGREAADQAEELERYAFDAKVVSELVSFCDLTPKEVDLLPERMQFTVPTISCFHLRDDRRAATDSDEPLTTCGNTTEENTRTKYLLKAAPLTTDHLVDVEVVADDENEGERLRFHFSDDGALKWQELAADNQGLQLATVVDGVVVGAPVIFQPHDSRFDVGGLDSETATNLAARINAGIGGDE